MHQSIKMGKKCGGTLENDYETGKSTGDMKKICFWGLWCSFAIFAGHAVAEITELDALSFFFNQTEGSGWFYKDNWLKEDDFCTWFGVRCVQHNLWLV